MFHFQLNPDITEAHILRGWYDNEGFNMESTSLTMARTQGKKNVMIDVTKKQHL